MRNDYYSNSKDYINRWVVSYADFVTMLLALFMVLFAVNGADSQKLTESIQKTFRIEQSIQSQTTQNLEIPSQIESNDAAVQNLETQAPQDKSADLYELLSDKFKNDTSLSVVKESRGTIIRINDTMLFDQGSAIIKSEAESTLQKIVSELKSVNNPIIIEGHTDTTPIRNARFPSNWELSTARATNIIKYLIDNDIISPTRLSAVGYGEYMPIDVNTTSSGRAKNRRVDILVLSTKN